MKNTIRKLAVCILAVLLAAGSVMPVGAEKGGVPEEVRTVLESGNYRILDAVGRDVTGAVLAEAATEGAQADPDALWSIICGRSCSLNWTRTGAQPRILKEKDIAGMIREILVYQISTFSSWTENVPGYGTYYVKVELKADIRVNASTNTIIAIENAGVQIETFLGGNSFSGASLTVQNLSQEIVSGKAYVTARYYLDLAVSQSNETVRRGQYYDGMIVDSQGSITFQTHHVLSS